ncbi:unnamed protein product [Notodromas monacha]|nr:unnamed protein product [Notodromas monacha]CAG0916286.1 unnamed protein product [Notodromas monacha]
MFRYAVQSSNSWCARKASNLWSSYSSRLARFSEDSGSSGTDLRNRGNPEDVTSDSSKPPPNPFAEARKIPNITQPKSRQNFGDLIFEAFKHDDDQVRVVDIFKAITSTGIPLSDPRLLPFMRTLDEIKRESCAESVKTLVLEKDLLNLALRGSMGLVSRALKNEMRVPDFTDLCATIDTIYEECCRTDDGVQATYIPQLAKMDRDLWGVSLCTVDGQRHSIGDSDVPFTIQSCIHKYVGKEPSGRMFNSLTLDYDNKPHNPMINSGAIVVCGILLSLVRPDMDLATKFEYVSHYLKALAGNEFIGFNNSVFLSERASGNRNYAIAHYLTENRCLPDSVGVTAVLDFYFQMCSFEATCESLSVIAATFANGGISPTTGEHVLKAEAVRDTLSLMHTCGMYDYSGKFAFFVGLPAKSGVSGAIMVVVPNIMGIATFAPPLDQVGNSCKGLQFCRRLVSRYNIHRFDAMMRATQATTSIKDLTRCRHDVVANKLVHLLFAAHTGDLSAFKRHKLSQSDVDLRDYDGRTPLHIAATEGHSHIVKYLLAHNANVGIRDR